MRFWLHDDIHFHPLYRFLFVLVVFFQFRADKAQAEYRAYELLISDVANSRTRTVISFLDDLQYVGYYPLNTGETIRIQTTWMCWRRADWFTPICPNQKALPSQNPPPSQAVPDAGPPANSTLPTGQTP